MGPTGPGKHTFMTFRPNFCRSDRRVSLKIGKLRSRYDDITSPILATSASQVSLPLSVGCAAMKRTTCAAEGDCRVPRGWCANAAAYILRFVDGNFNTSGARSNMLRYVGFSSQDGRLAILLAQALCVRFLFDLDPESALAKREAVIKQLVLKNGRTSAQRHGSIQSFCNDGAIFIAALHETPNEHCPMVLLPARDSGPWSP